MLGKLDQEGGRVGRDFNWGKGNWTEDWGRKITRLVAVTDAKRSQRRRKEGERSSAGGEL